MSVHYQVRLKSTAGTPVAVFDDTGGFLSLQYGHKVNGVSDFQLVLKGDDSRIPLFVPDAQIEIYRSNHEWDLDWYLEFEGVVRKPDAAFPSDGKNTFTAHGLGYADFLRRRIIAWSKGSAGASKSGAAERVLKDFVKENLGSLASITPPGPTVNYCLNPSFEVNVTDDWTLETSGAGGSRNLDANQYKVGTKSCRIRAGNGFDWVSATTGVSVPNGSTVTASAWVRCCSEPAGSDAYIRIRDVTNAVTRASKMASAAANSAWEYLSVSWTNNTGLAATCNMGCVNGYLDSASDVWFDACQLELSATASRYADGSLSGGGYSWDGTPHNSISRFTPVGRLASGIMTGLSIQVDGALGETWTGDRAYEKLVKVLQDIALATDFDFDIVGTGAGLFEFRTYAGQRGTDRSTIGLDTFTALNGAGNAPVIFSIENETMVDVLKTLDRSEEKNRYFVLGTGTDAARVVTISEDTTLQDDSPWNLCEDAVNGVTQGTTGASDVGAAALAKAKPETGLTFKVLQQAKQLYGKHYSWGDLVTARFDGVDTNLKITGMTGSFDASGERIEFDFERGPMNNVIGQMAERINQLQGRVSYFERAEG